jgi:hypothetical protein
VRAIYALGALAVLAMSGNCLADDLTAAKAEELLLPLMSKDCGSYYADSDQDEPDFADLNGKALCVYKPRVPRVAMSGNTAKVEYNHDRHFDKDISAAWLKDFDKMASHETPTPLFQALKKNLEKWRNNSAGVDSNDRPGVATFKLDASGWHVDSAPQDY